MKRISHGTRHLPVTCHISHLSVGRNHPFGNTLHSLIDSLSRVIMPGALLGLFVGSWAWMLRAQAESGNTSTALWVASFAGIFVCTGFFTWLLAQVPLVDLPLAQIAKNAGLMFFGFFPRTAVAALVLALYWGATLLYLPATILTILAFGFWLPVTIALMIVYPGLEKVFKLEETINARRAAEIEERMAQNQPKFDQ